jgi:mono/diheme cytochrome c family protein
MNRKVVYGLGVVVIAAIAVFLLQPKDQPGPQGHSMVPPDTGSIAQGDPIVTVALPAVLSSNAQIGKRGFDAKCAQCHGENAAGQNGVAPPLVHKIYEPNHHSDAAFLLAAKNGVRSHHWKFGNMPPVKGLTDADLKYIARYIRELQKENGIN